MNQSSKKDIKVENFPDNICDLLFLISKIENHKITLILNTYEDCILEDISLVGVMGSLILIRYNDKFKFVRIDCVCSVIADCDIVLDKFLESCSNK